MAIFVQGRGPIGGRVKVQGSKNAVLPMIAAAALTEETIVLKKCPCIQDVFDMTETFEKMGGESSGQEDCLVLEGKKLHCPMIQCQAAERIRASVLFMGSVLARMGKVTICYPGGCSIGSRPIDLHIHAFRKMGVEITEEERVLACEAPEGVRGAEVTLAYPSVGATENILLLAVLARGTTTIRNSAREPEIVQLCGLLISMGASIQGAGSPTIIIKGVKRLHGACVTVANDRVAALTYALLTAGCGGDVFLETEPVFSICEKKLLQELGCDMQWDEAGLRVTQQGAPRKIPYICTGPYPEFPTDGQSLLMPVLCKGSGSSTIEEKVFENRFAMVSQLRKMGADIDMICNRARINGVTRLHGARVDACDLRSGAGLMIAGAMAEGKTTIYNEQYIFRGYENILNNLQKIGIEAGEED